MAHLLPKYTAEAQKRIHPARDGQYVELAPSDPWATAPPSPIPSSTKVLIVGAGFTGITAAVHLIKNGVDAKHIILVDEGGGFGGTWYWNRYPGLMCDVESLLYLPLLEETGYKPKHRYSYGYEILEYLKLVVDKYGLQGVFGRKIESLEWKDSQWHVQLIGGTTTAQFVYLTNGAHGEPKVPNMDKPFKGDIIHTARWDYSVTGGSSTDWTLDKLKGKKVGMVGTGATAVQCLPELAKWASEVYVFQRTAASVDTRDQRVLTAEDLACTNKPGWQRERRLKWSNFVSGEGTADEDDYLKDSWSKMTTMKHIVGGVHEKPVTMEQIPALINQALEEDEPRAERIRQRVSDVVMDVAVAEKLKPWYPSWCKRPCFHDEYLQVFNLPHVHLVDTDGKGIGEITQDGIVANGNSYPLDLIVLSTGYTSVSKTYLDPSKMTNMTITGPNGTLSEQWTTKGASTLHGVLISNFPNLIVTGPSQVGVSPNYAHTIDLVTEHAAHIVSEAIKRQQVVQASEEAAGEWTMRIVMRLGWLGPMGVCGPNYMNNELAETDRERIMKGALFPEGVNVYGKALKSWRDEGQWKGLVFA